MIVLNEEENLPRTLDSVRWADEIAVVDSGSTNASMEIARKFGARVFTEPWKGFAKQKNSVIAHTTGDGVLSLDAYEEVSPKLAQEIGRLLASEPPLSAYRIPWRNHFLDSLCAMAATGPTPSCGSSATGRRTSRSGPFMKR
jgi:glycosyltransferase involved in cell wall biosynthesis